MTVNDRIPQVKYTQILVPRLWRPYTLMPSFPQQKTQLQHVAISSRTSESSFVPSQKSSKIKLPGSNSFLKQNTRTIPPTQASLLTRIDPPSERFPYT